MAASQSVSAILARTRMWASAARSREGVGRDFALFLSWKLFRLFKRVDKFENEKEITAFYNFFSLSPTPFFNFQFFGEKSNSHWFNYVTSPI